MRVLLASFVLAIVLSCAPVSDNREIERLEMRLSGWSSLDIVIDKDGNGTFKDSEPLPNGTTGRFILDHNELTELLASLRPYREQSVPFSDESAIEFVSRTCRDGVPYVTDAGAFYVRWRTATNDTHYLADFGCDHQRFADRNSTLRRIIEGLPIPIDW